MNNRRRMHQRALIMTYPYLKFKPKVVVTETYQDFNTKWTPWSMPWYRFIK